MLPVAAGHLLGRSFPQWKQKARRVGSTVANVAILWIIAAVVGLNRDRFAQLQPALLMALLAVIPVDEEPEPT